jgi:hypothetical protein
MFNKFPKKRPPLPPEFQDIYSEHYKRNRSGGSPASSLAQKMESWLHKQVARDTQTCATQKTTLEIGAGNLNQLPHERNIGPYDIVEPFKELYENSALLPRVRNIYDSMEAIPSGTKYDRITSIAAFEHICNLPEVIALCGVLLQDHGTLRVSIPNEGALLWKLGWQCTTGLEFKIRYGLNYNQLMQHEHVNTADEIEEILDYFFSDISRKSFGLSKTISLYHFFACRSPEMKRCHEFLNSRNKTV